MFLSFFIERKWQRQNSPIFKFTNQWLTVNRIEANRNHFKICFMTVKSCKFGTIPIMFFYENMTTSRFTFLHSNSKFNNEYEEILAVGSILSVLPWSHIFVFTVQAVQDGMLSCNLGYFGQRCLAFTEFDAEMYDGTEGLFIYEISHGNFLWNFISNFPRIHCEVIFRIKFHTNFSIFYEIIHLILFCSILMKCHMKLSYPTVHGKFYMKCDMKFYS